MTKKYEEHKVKTPLSQSELKDLLCHAPYWVRYLAVDKNGEVWGFAQEPVPDRDEWVAKDGSFPHWPMKFGEVDPPANFRKTLIGPRVT